MKLSEISSFKNKTARKIREGYMHQALAEMKHASEEQMNWELTSRIDSLADNYKYMLKYLAAGIVDPGRKTIYDDLRAEALMLVDMITRSAFMRENPALYYSTARTRSLRPGDTVAALISRFEAEQLRLDRDLDSIADSRRTLDLEGIQRDLFNALWTIHPLMSPDFEALDRVFDINAMYAFPEQLRGHLVSAVTMGLLEFYDPRRLEFLLKVYMGPFEETTRMRALVGALCAFYRYRSRPVPKEIASVLAAARDTADWNSDVASVAIELVRATGTDKIADKLNNEVIPSLMKIDPHLQAKIRSGDIDLEALSEGLNPEWEEKMRDSDMARGLKEIQEIQADGGDVFMGSFSHMKQFGFFNEIANWFLPFYDTHSTVADKDLPDGSLGTILHKLPILCDSDKYSMVLAFDTVPESQRATIIGAMGAQAAQMRDALNEVDKASDLQKRRNIVNKYVQGLYRFYKLFRRKNEFFPLFSQVPNLMELSAIGGPYEDEQNLHIMAEFMFSHKYWSQAAFVLAKLDRLASPDASRSQQLGYALENSGRVGEAISRYEEAEMLDGDSVWTLRRLASTLRRDGQSQRAVAYYRRLNDLLPDDPKIALALGYALSEAGDSQGAEPMFHKAAYLLPDSLQPVRALGWIQFLNRRFEQADASYSRVLESAPEAEDYLNAAHVKLAMGKVADAVSLYRKYSAADEAKDIEDALSKDARYMAKAGIDLSELKLLIEAIKYSQE